VALAALLLAACAGGDGDADEQDGGDRTPPQLPPGDDTVVERVTDGDTIVVGGNDVVPETRVRLIGMDAPEATGSRDGMIDCFGREATERITELVPVGTPVRLVYDVSRTDRFGRTLAYVYRRRDGLFVNLAIVRDGYAVVYTVPPDVAHAEDFRVATAAARAAERGLWGGCDEGEQIEPRP
jgi:micrococcal nuclease